MQKHESWKGRYVWERNEQWIETEQEKNMLLLFFNMLVLTSFSKKVIRKKFSQPVTQDYEENNELCYPSDAKIGTCEYKQSHLWWW